MSRRVQIAAELEQARRDLERDPKVRIGKGVKAERDAELLKLPFPSPPQNYLPIQAVEPDKEPPGGWHVTVCSADNRHLIFHAEAPDYVMARMLAGEARSHDARFQIWLRSPRGRVYSW